MSKIWGRVAGMLVAAFVVSGCGGPAEVVTVEDEESLRLKREMADYLDNVQRPLDDGIASEMPSTETVQP